MAYAIEIARSVVAQIEALSGAERARVLDGIEKHLRLFPRSTMEWKRCRMKPNNQLTEHPRQHRSN